jgi:hypothetical protein
MNEAGARFAWVLNLDAELELARSVPGYSPPRALLLDLERYAGASRDLLGPSDVQVSSGVVEGAGWTGRAWCPTPLALAKLRAAGVEPEPHPPASVLRRVNHRRFAFELGGGLFDQHYVEAREPLDALLRNAEHPWLLKRPLAFAGRGQLRVYGSVDPKQSSWIDASLRSDGLIVEPLVEPALELSLHGFIWRDGRQELGHICAQDVSVRGVFRGIRRAERQELSGGEFDALFMQATRVAAALHGAGYFGPFGIDAYRYRRGQSEGFCALGEINARYTMGFVTGFPRHPSQLLL